MLVPLKGSVERKELESVLATWEQFGGVPIDGEKPIDTTRTADTTTAVMVRGLRENGCSNVGPSGGCKRTASGVGVDSSVYPV